MLFFETQCTELKDGQLLNGKRSYNLWVSNVFLLFSRSHKLDSLMNGQTGKTSNMAY